jgi:hypothetical protein
MKLQAIVYLSLLAVSSQLFARESIRQKNADQALCPAGSVKRFSVSSRHRFTPCAYHRPGQGPQSFSLFNEYVQASYVSDASPATAFYHTTSDSVD